MGVHRISCLLNFQRLALWEIGGFARVAEVAVGQEA